MVIRRLLPVFLVLMQSGLAGAHSHTHPNSGTCADADTPHVHVCELLELLITDQDDNEPCDNHEADAIDLSGVLSDVAPSVVEFAALDLPPVEVGLVFESPSSLSAFSLGVPLPTAGPGPPLYLTFCTLTI